MLHCHLQSEREEIYKRVSRQIIGTNQQPIILVDWSDIDARREYFLLRASVAISGRSLTLYEEVHSKKTKERRSTHNAFLQKLKDTLPVGCTPILVTDAGFRTPWFHQVARLGWDYVGRVRNRKMVQITADTSWIGAKSLYQRATKKAVKYADALLTRSNPIKCTLILFKGPLKGRKRLTKMGRNAQNRTSLVNAARAREPWLLATSLSTPSPKSVVDIYSQRMQIEETFRDLKCPRFGLSLYHNRTYKIERLKILVMLGSLATNFAWLLGKLARSLQLHRQFQANTTATVKVLSNVFLGIQIMRNSHLRIPWRKLQQQIHSIENQLFLYS